MWVIVKFESGKLNFLKNELKKRIKSHIEFYNPKLKIKVQNKFKTFFKEIGLLNNYVFINFENFEKLSQVQNYRFTKGIKYFLNGSDSTQKEIQNFVQKCKDAEDKDGFLKHNLYNFLLNNDYKFTNGPFANTIFKLLKVESKKIEILMGNLRTKVSKNKFLVSPL